jgi:hypothetical protein
MRIAYLSTDPVNAALAGQLAAACGLDLSQADPRGAARPDGTRAALFDLDFLPREHLERLLEELGQCPAAAHGYNLGGGLRRRLKAAGVFARRRLAPPLFKWLRAALVRQAQPQHGEPEEVVIRALKVVPPDSPPPHRPGTNGSEHAAATPSPAPERAGQSPPLV